MRAQFQEINNVVDGISKSDITRIATELFIIVLVSILVYKISIKILKKFLKHNKIMNERRKGVFESIATSSLKILVLFVSMLQVLEVFNINSSSVIAVLGAASVAIGLAMQDVIRDFIMGFMILAESQYHIGDYIEINGKKGTVQAVNIRTTILQDFDGTKHIIPNGKIDIISNITNEVSKAGVTVGIEYAEDIEKVFDILDKLLEDVYNDMEEIIAKPVLLGIVGFGESSVDIKMTAECARDGKWAVEREIRKRIKKTFDAEGISIPFPQRVVHITKE